MTTLQDILKIPNLEIRETPEFIILRSKKPNSKDYFIHKVLKTTAENTKLVNN